MPDITLRGVTKIYPFVKPGLSLFQRKRLKMEREKQLASRNLTDEGVLAVQGLDLMIPSGEFLVLLGPSGCGKTTVLRMIAGLEDITAGDLYFGETQMNAVPPHKRGVAMVFQNYSLYPHLTVYENMAFALKNQRIPREEIDETVRQIARVLDLSGKLDRKPRELSGGERQRVAIGRALVRKPELFLMDEPFSNLDTKLRTELRNQLQRLHASLPDTTFVYVTHDQMEATMLGDRVVVMNEGAILQQGTPRRVYLHPDNLFVAQFVGSPKMNLIDDAVLVCEGENYHVQALGTRFALPAETAARLLEHGVTGQPVILGIRPVNLSLSAEGITARVDLVEPMGAETHLYCTVQGKELVCVVSAEQLRGAPMFRGQTVTLAPDGHRLHLFDPNTEQNLLPY